MYDLYDIKESKVMLSPNFPKRLAYAICDHCRELNIPRNAFINNAFNTRIDWFWMQEEEYIKKLVKNIVDGKEMYYKRDMIPVLMTKEDATTATNIGIYLGLYRNRILWVSCALALDQYNCDNPKWESFTE